MAFASEQVSPLEDVTKMKWRAPDSEYGIQVICDKDICLLSEASEEGKESAIIIKADNQIKLETDSTVMEVDKEKIRFNAEYVYLGDEE